MAAVCQQTAAVGAETPDSLNVTPRELSEVVVTGSNIAVERNLLPYTVSILDSRQLEASTEPRLLSDLSMTIPSLFVSERGILGYGVSNGGSGHIKLRGVGGDRASGVLMMVDGQPQFAGIYSHHIADMYTKENVERVEVLRGPGSVIYGSNAMAGVINVITRKPESKGIHTSLSAQYGSYNTLMTSLTNTINLGAFSTYANLAYDRTDGNIKDLTFNQWSGYVKTAYQINSKWSASADFTLSNVKSHDPVYPRLSDPESTDVYRQNITRGDASISITDRYATHSGNLLLYYSYGNHFIDDPRHFHSTDDRLGAMIYQNFKPWRGNDMTVGFDFDTYSGRIPTSGGKDHTDGSLTTMGRKRITEYSPYLTLSQSLFDSRLILNGGVRMANSDMFDTQWVPQGGVTFNIVKQLSVKGSIATGYRNPSFRELYLYRMANPDLQPERMTNIEVSVSNHFGRFLSASVTAYYSRGRNMIQTVDQKNMNTGRFINKGIELSAESAIRENLSLSATYSYLATTLSNLTGAPRQQYSLSAIYRPTAKLQLSGNLRGAAHLFVSEEMDHQSFATLNLKATYQVLPMLSLMLSADNLTDARYQINRGYEMPGITVMGGFRLSL